MAKIDPPGKASNAQRLLYASWFLFAVGVALYLAGFVMAGSATLASVAAALRTAAPWVIYVAAILLFLFLAARRRTPTQKDSRAEQAMFGQSTTMFHEPEPRRAPREPPAAPPREPETEL